MASFPRNPLRLLLVVTAAYIVLLGAELPGPVSDAVGIAAALLLSGLLYRIRGRAAEALVLLLLGLAAPLLDLAVPWGAVPVLDVVKVGFWTAAPAFLAWKLFAAIYDVPQVTGEEIFGALALYLLIGLLFANVYEGLLMLDPQGLRFGGHFPSGDEADFGDVLYFSFVTLATLGYGDISPAHPLTRVVAITESVAGLMYIAVLVTRFVSLHVGTRRDQ